MMKLSKEQLLNLFKKNKIIFIVIFIFVIGSILLLNRGTYSVNGNADSLVINCPDSVSGGSEIECLIELNSVSFATQGISSNFNVSGGLNFVSFTPNENWNDYANSEDGFVLVSKNSSGITGNSTVGTVKYTVPSDATSNTIYKIELSNAEIGDGDIETVVFNDIYDEIRIISNVNTLNNIELSVGKLNEIFDKNKKEYTANVDGDKVVVSAIKTDNNSVVSGDVGEVNLHYGTNVFNIDVTSETGVKNTYKLSIYREYKLSNDKYVYSKENNYLYTYNDVDNEVILNNINLVEGLSKKIENNKLIISYNNENLLEINILNVSFNKFVVKDKLITINGDIILNNFAGDMNISSKLSYSVFNGNKVVGINDVLQDGSVIKIYYNDVELDSYNIKVIPFSLSIDQSLIVDDNNSYINYLQNNMKVSELLKKFSIIGGSIKIFNVDGVEIGVNNLISTGDKVVIYKKNDIVKEYKVSVLGDINGDSVISLTDLVQIRKYIAKWVDPLTNQVYNKTGVFYNSMDLDKDGNVGLVDLVQIRKIIARVK